MANIVQERVMVFFFKTIKEDTLESLRNAFDVFLMQEVGMSSFVFKRINTPMISHPDSTEGDSEPDWTKLKVGIGRLYRYETVDGRFMFQLSRDFFSFNALNAGDESKGAGSGEELVAFCEKLNSFSSSVLAKHVKIEDARYDTIYCALQDNLKPFLEKPRGESKYDYYNVFKLFRNIGEGSQNDAWGLHSPLEQRFLFSKRADEAKREVEICVKAGMNTKQSWYLEVKTSCCAHKIDSISDTIKKMEYLFGMQKDFDECAKVLLERIFSDAAMKILKGSNDE